jgi:hypothetical protein
MGLQGKGANVSTSPRTRRFLRAHFFDQIGGLLERYLAIAVAMNQQPRRTRVRVSLGFEFIERKPLMMQGWPTSVGISPSRVHRGNRLPALKMPELRARPMVVETPSWGFPTTEDPLRRVAGAKNQLALSLTA